MKKGWIVLSLGLLAVCLSAFPAQGGERTREGAILDPQMKFRNPAWGSWSKRVGVSQFTFLKIGQGARAEAMAGAYTALSDDIGAAFWNPAGLGHIEHAAYTINYTRWLADSKLISGALAFNAGFGVLGISVISFAAAEVEETTPTAPWGTGTMIQAGDIAIAAMFAKKMTDKFMLGGQVRWLQEDLYLEKSNNVDFSVGTLFYTGFRSTRIAMSFRNIGPNVQVTEGGDTFQMPVVFQLGGAMEFYGGKGDPTYGTLSLEHQFITDYQAVTRVGAEVWIQNTLALRGGYRTGFELENWSLGLGLQHRVINDKMVTVDVSYHNEREGIFEAPIRVSVGGTF